MTDHRSRRIDPDELAVTLDEWQAGHERADAARVEVVLFHQPHPALLIA